jgi:hypothetical protein
VPKKNGTKSSGGAQKRQEISVYARRKGLPKAAQQAAKAASKLSPRRAGTKKTVAGSIYTGSERSAAKYDRRPTSARGTSPASTTPLFGTKYDKRAKAKVEATKAKMSGKKSPSLGISKRRSSTKTGATKSIGYQGMRPGPLR